MDFGGAAGAGAQMGVPGAEVDLMSWYMEIPPVSRLYLTGAFLTTAMCALDIISPFYLYFNWDLVVSHGQLWRLVTSYLFFGLFSIDYLFHMYFLVRCLLIDHVCVGGNPLNARVLWIVIRLTVATFLL